jgi:hypothetical protein
MRARRGRRPDAVQQVESGKVKQMSHIQLYEQSDMDYSSNDNLRRGADLRVAKRQRPVGRRRGKSPQSINGIHRRRNRKMAW